MASPLNPVVDECKRLRKTLLPVSEKYHGLSDQFRSKNTLFPFVLLLGNHSSGKSSFINHILKRKVQATGVAPTDDNFTIIGPGDCDIDRNGPALVGDPDLGFEDLKTFGPVLVNHTQLKVRANTAVTDFMIVDSPGMIDSPVSNKALVDSPVGMDRGYNFEGVCRWYAERADVILLFFDPDKPGTTGETLSILTTALVGLDHKMFIILNKADQFHKIHDFARAYGSLCWNLSKVIPRKDLPRIHTMCLPSTAVSTSPLDPEQFPTLSSPARTPPPASPVLNAMLSVGLMPQSESQTSTPCSSSSTAAELWNYEDNSSNTVSDAFAPVEMPTHSHVTKSNGMQPGTQHKSFFEQGIHDLEESRAEVEMETFNAPRRRVDNEISRLTEIVSSLQMHCNIVDKALELYHNRLWRARTLILTSLGCSIGITIGAYYLCDVLLPVAWGSSFSSSSSSGGSRSSSVSSAHQTGDGAQDTKVMTSGGVAAASSTSSVSSVGSVLGKFPVPTATLKPSTHAAPTFYSELWNFRSKRTVVGWTALSSVLSTSAVILWEHLSLQKLLNTFNEKATFEEIYRRIYNKELTAQDEFTTALGKAVLDDMPANVTTDFIQHAQRVEKGDFSALRRILHDDIPNLRRRASPQFPVLTTPIRLLSQTPSTGNLTLTGVSERAVSPNTAKLENLQHSLTSSGVGGGSNVAKLRVHFSPSTASSPITTRESQEQLLQQRRNNSNNNKKSQSKKTGRTFSTTPASSAGADTASGVNVAPECSFSSSEGSERQGIAGEKGTVTEVTGTNGVPGGSLLGAEEAVGTAPGQQGRLTPSPTFTATFTATSSVAPTSSIGSNTVHPGHADHSLGIEGTDDRAGREEDGFPSEAGMQAAE